MGGLANNRRKTPTKGVLHHGLKRIVVSFDTDTFDQIRGHADRAGVSFACQVRELVEFGLMDIEGADA